MALSLGALALVALGGCRSDGDRALGDERGDAVESPPDTDRRSPPMFGPVTPRTGGEGVQGRSVVEGESGLGHPPGEYTGQGADEHPGLEPRETTPERDDYEDQATRPDERPSERPKNERPKNERTESERPKNERPDAKSRSLTPSP